MAVALIFASQRVCPLLTLSCLILSSQRTYSTSGCIENLTCRALDHSIRRRLIGAYHDREKHIDQTRLSTWKPPVTSHHQFNILKIWTIVMLLKKFLLWILLIKFSTYVISRRSFMIWANEYDNVNNGCLLEEILYILCLIRVGRLHGNRCQ